MNVPELLGNSPFSEEELEWLGAVDEQLILSTEDELRYTFPSDFRGFLKAYGGGGPIDSWVSGIGTEEKKYDCGYIIGDTLYFQKEYSLSNDYIVIQRDQDDNDPFCYNKNDNQIYTVSLHSNKAYLVAKKFTSFFKEYILFCE